MTQIRSFGNALTSAARIFAIASMLLGMGLPLAIAQTNSSLSQAQPTQPKHQNCKSEEQKVFAFYLFAAGDYSQGIAFDSDYLRQNEAQLRQIIQSSPFNLEAHLNLASVLVGLGLESSTYDEALRIYNYVASRDVGGSLTPAAQIGIGNILALQYKYDEAIAQYQQVIQNPKANPERLADAHRNTGVVLSQICQEDAAISAYKNAIATRPIPVFSFAEGERLRELLKKQNRLADIVPFYREQLLQKPQAKRLLLQELGSILLNDLRRFSEAEQVYRNLIEVMQVNLIPEDYSAWLPSAYISLANSLREQGKRQESLAAYQTAVEIYTPGDNGLDIGIGLADDLRQYGLPDLAIAILQKMLAFRPNDINGFINLGQLFEQQGKLPEAVAAYKKALAIQPRSDFERDDQQRAKQYLQVLER